MTALPYRLKDMQISMDKQLDLLRLVVQKMEIVSEADQYDEGWFYTYSMPRKYTFSGDEQPDEGLDVVALDSKSSSAIIPRV